MWWCFGVVFTGGVIGWCYQVTYLAILVSSPAYLNSLVRPERVPRNAVSTPSITLQRKHLHLQKHSADITLSLDVLVSFDRRMVLVVFDVAMVLVVLVVFDVMLVFDLMMVFDRRVVFDVMVVLVVLVVFDVMMVFDVRVVLVVFDLMVVLGC